MDADTSCLLALGLSHYVRHIHSVITAEEIYEKENCDYFTFLLVLLPSFLNILQKRLI